jgi:transcriptional regulator with XRE-family HTH domain
MKSEIILDSLSNRMISVRNRLNLTQKELAARLNISKNYVYLIECGEKRGGKKVREKLDYLEKESGIRLDNAVQPEKPPKTLFRIVSASAPEVSVSTLESMLEACEAAKDFDSMAVVARELMRRAKLNGNSKP